MSKLLFRDRYRYNWTTGRWDHDLNSFGWVAVMRRYQRLHRERFRYDWSTGQWLTILQYILTKPPKRGTIKFRRPNPFATT